MSAYNSNQIAFLEANRNYAEMFVQSLQFKDWGMLRNSLDTRRKATSLTKNKSGMKAIGKANEANLLFFHIGNGIQTYETAKEALENIDEFTKIDKDWQMISSADANYSLLLECFRNAIATSNHHDEAINYCEQAIKYFPNNSNLIVQLKDLKQSKERGTMWWQLQFYMSLNFADRSTPEKNNGKYAGAMSLLNCVLTRAIEEKPGYEPDDEEIFNMLDDCLFYSLLLYNEIFSKFQLQLQQDNQVVAHCDGAKEQFIIFEEPLKCWFKLMPECPTKWKSKFADYYKKIMLSPYPIFPEIMNEIGKYFSDIQINKQIYLPNDSESSKLTPLTKAQKRILITNWVTLVTSLIIGGYLWHLIFVTEEPRIRTWILAVITTLIFLEAFIKIIKRKRVGA